MYKARIKKLTRKLMEDNVEGLVVNKPENQYYISGFSGEGITIITRHKNYIIY